MRNKEPWGSCQIFGASKYVGVSQLWFFESSPLIILPLPRVVKRINDRLLPQFEKIKSPLGPALPLPL